VPKPAVPVTSAAANIISLAGGKASSAKGIDASGASSSTTSNRELPPDAWTKGKKVFVPSGCGRQGLMCIDCASDVGYVLNAYGTW
jgi:hypothetical protein